MRTPSPVKMLVGEDGDPRGMVVGMRVGPHRTVHGLMRVVVYAPTTRTTLTPKQRSRKAGRSRR